MRTVDLSIEWVWSVRFPYGSRRLIAVNGEPGIQIFPG
jgi:hypothetical protein